MAEIEAVTDYSQTQRIVLLIDLNPLFHNHHHHHHTSNPSIYISTLLSAAKTLLSFPPLFSSLFSFKPFFSSLSPLLSSSKLPSSSSLSLSFNDPTSTLHSLTSLLSTIEKKMSSITSLSHPQASQVAASMRQLVHDYAWDSAYDSNVAGMNLVNCDSSVIKSNLVILFSPIVRCLSCLSEFLGVELEDECLRNVNGFKKKFCGFFENVNGAFVSRDIHFSWVDVNCEMASDHFHESGLGSGFFESAIRVLGWGFCSAASIILGSALVPFGLIFPIIVISPKFLDFNVCPKLICTQLNLEILDVNGKPLECKCCDLQLVNLNIISRIKAPFMDSQIDGCEQKKTFWEGFSDGITKIHVKSVQKYNKCVKFEGSLSDLILVSEHFGDSKKEQKESCSGMFEDRVLEILGCEMGELVSRKSLPIWQIFLSFLCREGYWAIVSLSNGKGISLTGILKPFSVSSALLSFIQGDFHPHGMTQEFEGASLGQFVGMKKDNEACKPEVNLNHIYGPIGSQSRPSIVGKKKKSQRSLNMLQELTWSDFCKAALENFQIDLEEVYFARENNKSKKLKFLQCWMKQIKKSSCCSLAMLDRSKLCQEIPKELDNQLTELAEESEQPVASCASAGEDCLSGASGVQGEGPMDFCSETMEIFFTNLPQKIQQGLESQDMDLGSLAERLVNATIYWLYKKYEKETTSESQGPTSIAVAELTKLLLKEPKDLAYMRKNSRPSSSTEATSDNIVRQYELQILFRMEILQSEVGVSIGESVKNKFVKQICLLLEAIQCHLKGGFFGDWNLDKYVGKTIKNRYCQGLGDVVDKIYAKMDLLLFTDEDESLNPLLSEDSNQSLQEKQQTDETGENYRREDQHSADVSIWRMQHKYQCPQQMSQDDHARKLIEAQERRQRARRFASFTSWVPDLQRVWAPKQPKVMKPKSDPLKKRSKRKEPRRAGYDTVCETPMTGKKQSCLRGSSSGDQVHQDCWTPYSSSVSKALFRDDC